MASSPLPPPVDLTLSDPLTADSGGILRALELRTAQLAKLGLSPPPLIVDVHPDRPIRRGLAPGPKFVTITNWPPDPSFTEIAARDGRVDARDEAHTILAPDGAATGVGVSGEIPRVHPFERGLKGAVTWMPGGNDDGTDGGWCTDEQIRDERYLAIDVKGKGLVLFSACSHAGICNVVTDAVKRFARPVHMVVGGLHLVPVETQPVDETVAFLTTGVQPRPDWVVPLHCTGFTPRAKLIEAFGDKCVCVGTGVKVVVDGDEGGDAALDEVDVKIL